jgi:hypothetical protein
MTGYIVISIAIVGMVGVALPFVEYLERKLERERGKRRD